MTKQPAARVLCLTRCHRRAERLTKVLKHWLEEIPALGIETGLVFCPDRPTPAVASVVAQWKDHPRVLGIVESKEPMLAPGKAQCLMGRLNDMLDLVDSTTPKIGTARSKLFCQRRQKNLTLSKGGKIRASKPVIIPPQWDWMCHANDDLVIHRPDARLKAMLLEPSDKALCYYFASIYPRLGGYDISNHHYAPFITRYQRLSRHALYPHLQMTWPVWARILCNDMHPLCWAAPFYLLDMGTKDEEERVALYKERRACGMIRDANTEQLVQPPNVVSCEYFEATYGNAPEKLLNEQWARRGFPVRLRKEQVYGQQVEPPLDRSAEGAGLNPI